MIVPRTRLLIWVAALGLPLAAAAPFSEIVALSALVVALGFVALVATDAYRSWVKLERIAIYLPDIVRLIKDREANLELLIERTHSESGVWNSSGTEEQEPRGTPAAAPGETWPLRLGVLLPPEFSAPQEELWVCLPADSPCSQLRWPCTPLSRGRFGLSRGFAVTVSPLGFWDVRAEVPVRALAARLQPVPGTKPVPVAQGVELRVYPNLMTERKHVAVLFLRRAGWGIRPQRQVGQGREFEKLREYIFGDSLNEIHWKATAKRCRPITKMFQVERTQEVYVLLDTSRLSARKAKGPGGGKNAAAVHTNFLERYMTAALILGLAAERQGDLFGLLAFSDGIDAFLRASQGKQHFTACREALYTLQPRMVTPDFNALTAFIRTRLRRRALLVLLTSLDDPVLAEDFSRNAALLARQHLLLANMLRPEGVQALFSSPAEKTEQVYEHLSGHLLWSQLRELQQSLHHQGVQFSLIDSELLAPRLVSDYCVVKERQLV